MDEQTTSTEPVTTTPDPVVADIPTTEPPQVEPTQAPIVPVAVAETPQIEPLLEPLPTTPEASTPHLPVDEALPETVPEAAPQGAVGPQGSLPFSKTDDRQENLVAPAGAPKMETPAPSSTPIPDTNTPDETPRTPPQTQQGTTQPELCVSDEMTLFMQELIGDGYEIEAYAQNQFPDGIALDGSREMLLARTKNGISSVD